MKRFRPIARFATRKGSLPPKVDKSSRDGAEIFKIAIEAVLYSFLLVCWIRRLWGRGRERRGREKGKIGYGRFGEGRQKKEIFRKNRGPSSPSSQILPRAGHRRDWFCRPFRGPLFLQPEPLFLQQLSYHEALLSGLERIEA